MRCNGAVKILSFDGNENCTHELAVVDRQDGGSIAPITLITLSGSNMRTSVLVVAQQTALRAAVARVLLPLGYQVEVAESEKLARQLIGKERFAAAVVAAASVAAGELALLHEVQGAVGKLVVLADDARAGERLATSFPEALVCASQPLEHEKLLAFLGGLTPPKASIHDPHHTASRPNSCISRAARSM